MAALILYAASTAAFFVDHATQPQCLVKCVSDAGHDPIWARLLLEAFPSILALGIAALVFYWNGGREHKRWVLDQKRAEWRELLEVINECQLDILIASTPVNQAPERSKDDLMAANLKLMKAERVLDDRVFIDRSVLKPLISKWRTALKKRSRQPGPATPMSLQSNLMFRSNNSSRQCARQPRRISGLKTGWTTCRAMGKSPSSPAAPPVPAPRGSAS